MYWPIGGLITLIVYPPETVVPDLDVLLLTDGSDFLLTDGSDLLLAH